MALSSGTFKEWWSSLQSLPIYSCQGLKHNAVLLIYGFTGCILLVLHSFSSSKAGHFSSKSNPLIHVVKAPYRYKICISHFIVIALILLASCRYILSQYLLYYDDRPPYCQIVNCGIGSDDSCIACSGIAEKAKGNIF